MNIANRQLYLVKSCFFFVLHFFRLIYLFFLIFLFTVLFWMSKLVLYLIIIFFSKIYLFSCRSLYFGYSGYFVYSEYPSSIFLHFFFSNLPLRGTLFLVIVWSSFSHITDSWQLKSPLRYAWYLKVQLNLSDFCIPIFFSTRHKVKFCQEFSYGVWI